MKGATGRAMLAVRFLLAVLVLGWAVAMSVPRAAAATTDADVSTLAGAQSHTLAATSAPVAGASGVGLAVPAAA